MHLPLAAITARAYLRASRRQQLHGHALRTFQQARGFETVSRAVQSCSYYRERYAARNLRRWWELPIMEKSDLMHNFAACNAAGIGRDEALAVALAAESDRNFQPSLRGITVGLSSGTSGHRGIFLASAQEQALWAGAVLARLLRRIPLGLRVAFCLRSFSRLYQAVDSPLLQLRYFDIATEPELLAAQIMQYNPQVLIAPASLLRLLAERQESGAMVIRPERVISVAEVLDPLDRRCVEQAFGVQLEQIYQCTEGFLAASCAHGSLHIQEDIVLLQEEAIAGMPGESGHGRRIVPVITDLWRHTQPIIRYRLNDVLLMAERRCGCGSAFRVIERVEGRADDMLLLRERDRPERWRHVFADTVRTALLLASPSIRSYHVLQDQADCWKVTLEVEESAPFTSIADDARSHLGRRCEQLGLRAPRIEVVAGRPQPRDVRGKLRRVERQWQGPPNGAS